MGVEKKERSDYSHGSHWSDENGNEYMDDHLNGVDWHVPNRERWKREEDEDEDNNND